MMLVGYRDTRIYVNFEIVNRLTDGRNFDGDTISSPCEPAVGGGG